MLEQKVYKEELLTSSPTSPNARRVPLIRPYLLFLCLSNLEFYGG